MKVLAASSLRDLLGGLEGECEREIDVDLEFSFGASSTLSRRIEAGGGCDVFLSADAQSLDRVLDQLDPETRHVFLANRLALVSGPASGEEAGRIDDPADLVECVGDIAIGGPTVPAGRYARRWLQGAGLLPRLEPRFQNARSARAALTMVAGGAVPFGFVYSSDARSTATVVLLWESGAGEAPRIEFVAARGAGARPEANAFLAWLEGDRFLGEAEREGFLVIDSHPGEVLR